MLVKDRNTFVEREENLHPEINLRQAEGRPFRNQAQV